MKQVALIKGARRPVRQHPGYEHVEQARLISWARDTARLQQDPVRRAALEWLHAIPNGAHLSKTQALKLKAEGLTAGVWDLRLDYVVRDSSGSINCPGLIIEMKMPGRYLTDEQKEYQAFMHSQGFRHVLGRGWQEAARSIIDYMSLKVSMPIYP